MGEHRTWIALVTFERTSDDSTDFLPDWALGACGYMAAIAASEEEARSLIERDLTVLDLRLVEIEEVREAIDSADIEEVDDHLAENVRTFEPGKRTAWGTLHCYVGEGEA